MKRLLTILSILILIGFIGNNLALARTSKERARIRRNHTITGEVVSVNTTANTLALKDAKGEQTIPADAQTKITVDGKPATLSDIEPGEKISLFFKIINEKRVAVTIDVTK